jgi:hypothetical protein
VLHVSVPFLMMIVVSIGFAIAAGLGLLQAAYRSWNLPFCWRCGARGVHYSTSHYSADDGLRLLWLVPYRCWVCQCRFYGFRSHHSLPASPHLVR